MESFDDLYIGDGDSYYYLTSDIIVSERVTAPGYINIGSGQTLYLCLHGHDVISNVDNYDVFRLSGTGKLVLCDCEGMDVNTWGKIIHASGANGRGIVMGGNQNNDNDPVFEMYDGNITGNTTNSDDINGAGVYADYGAAFTMYGGAITQNTTQQTGRGGGVCLYADATFTMNGGIIKGNTAYRGGGIYNDSVNTAVTGVTINGGTITGNTADYGGGLYVGRNNYSSKVQDLIITAGSISGNTAYYHGGGVYLYYAQATMSDGTISNNETTYNTSYTPDTKGGGVHIESSLFNMNGGSITGNVAEAGAGVYMDQRSYGMTAQANATVANNSKDNVYLESGKYIVVTGPLTGTIGVYTQDTPATNAPVRYLKPDKGYTLTTDDLNCTSSDRGFTVKNIDWKGYGIFGNVQYQVTVNTEGSGTASASSTLAEAGTAITLTATPAEGYNFKEWRVASGGVTITDNKFTMPAENVSVKAVFVPNQYTITFDTAGGSEIAPITQDYGSAVMPPADPTKEGYTFAGWDKAIPEIMPAENITITANWTINQYNITFVSDGAEHKKLTQDYGTVVTPPADPQKSDWTFIGWEPEVPATMPAKNMTITAQWAPNASQMELYSVYSVTHYQEQAEGTYAEVMEDTQFPLQAKVGDKVSATAKNYTGYTYNAAKSTASATLMKAEAGDDGQPVYTKLELYYDLNTYTITFDTAGGSAIAPITQDYGSAVTAPADPTKDGYTFAGWDKAIPETMSAEDVVITALWKAVEAPTVPTPTPTSVPSVTKLRIIQHPVDQVVAPGERAEFCVVAVGDGLTYQWYIDRNDGRSWVKLQGATGATHVISEAELAYDGFQYLCEVRDCHGNMVHSNVAVLYVAAQPDLPATGDSTNLPLLSAMLLLSLAGCLLLASRKRMAN